MNDRRADIRPPYTVDLVTIFTERYFLLPNHNGNGHTFSTIPGIAYRNLKGNFEGRARIVSTVKRSKVRKDPPSEMHPPPFLLFFYSPSLYDYRFRTRFRKTKANHF